MKAYRQDFAAMAGLLTAGRPGGIALADITKSKMRAAFAAYASTHEPASIRRCRSTWNVLCDFRYTAELIPANPMPFIGRPKATKTLPRSLSPVKRSGMGKARRAGSLLPKSAAVSGCRSRTRRKLSYPVDSTVHLTG